MNRYKGVWISSTFELIVAVFLVALAAAFMLSAYRAARVTADEGILTAQLRALRMQEKLFRVVHGKRPVDLRELVNDSYSRFPMGAKQTDRQPVTGLVEPEAVLAAAADEDGFPVDPWGRRYEVDPVTGRIHAVAGNYEDW